MRTRKAIVDSMMKSSATVKNKHLSREDLEMIISDYVDSAFQVLLANGYVNISEDLSISLVRLKDRQYVLRGNSYSNHRKYKLKVISSRELYERIEDAFNLLVEV